MSLLPKQQEKIESPLIDITDEELEQLEQNLREVREKTIKRLELVADTGLEGNSATAEPTKTSGDD